MKKLLTDTSTFLILSITLIALLVPQPFNDLNRGIVYGLIVAYGAIFCIFNAKKIFARRSWIFWLGLTFYIETILAYCINGNLMRVGFAHLQYLFIFLAASTLRNEDNLSHEIYKLSKIFTILGIGMALCSIFTVFIVKSAPQMITLLPTQIARMIVNSGKIINHRITGFGTNANLTGNFCALALLMSIYLMLIEKMWKWKALSITNIVLCINIIFIKCASRTSMLLVMGGTLCFSLILLFTGKNKNTKRILKYTMLTIMILLVIILIIFAFNSNLRTWLLKNVIRIDSLKTGSGRTDLFIGSFSITEGHRLFGINKQVFIDEFGLTSPHNSYLELMVHAGLPAMLLFIAFYLSTLVKSGLVLARAAKKTTVANYTIAFIFTYLLAITFHMMLDNYMIASYTTIGMFGHYALGTVIALDENRKTTENP